MENQTITVTGILTMNSLSVLRAAGARGSVRRTTAWDAATRAAQRHLHAAPRTTGRTHFCSRANGLTAALVLDRTPDLKKRILARAETAREKFRRKISDAPVLDFGERNAGRHIVREVGTVANGGVIHPRLLARLAVLKKPELRAQENRLAQSVGYVPRCEAVFEHCQMDLVPGWREKYAPEDIANSPLRIKYLLLREMPGGKNPWSGRKSNQRRSGLRKINREKTS